MCFDGETPVCDFEDHFTKIERLRVGDRVWSRDELTGEMALKRIIKVYQRSAQQYGVRYNAGPEHVKRFGGPYQGYTYVTGEHPFWVQGKGWVAVRDLKPGDVLLTHNGDPATILSVSTPEELLSPGYVVPPALPVYNLEVEDFNTYFVDTPGVWVHNCTNTPPSGIVGVMGDRPRLLLNLR